MDKTYLCKNRYRIYRLGSIQMVQVWSRALSLQSNARMLWNGKNTSFNIWPPPICKNANSHMRSLIVLSTILLGRHHYFTSVIFWNQNACLRASILPIRILRPIVFAWKHFEDLTPVNRFKWIFCTEAFLLLLLLHPLTDAVINKYRCLKAY